MGTIRLNCEIINEFNKTNKRMYTFKQMFPNINIEAQQDEIVSIVKFGKKGKAYLIYGKIARIVELV